MKDVFVVAAKRTPFGTYGGKLTRWTATDLQEVATRAALQAGKVNPEIVSSIVIGNVFHVRFNSQFNYHSMPLIFYTYISEDIFTGVPD